jgi:hypothetical protein
MAFSSRHVFASAEVGVPTNFSSFWVVCLPLLCNLFIRALQIMDLRPAAWERRCRSGALCVTWPAALVGLFTGLREKYRALRLNLGDSAG